MLCEGILIQTGKVWFWLDSNNNSNEMVSATLFRYKNQSSQKWRRIHKSRFLSPSLSLDSCILGSLLAEFMITKLKISC
ncbi:hypothetical protein Hanom_Chr01g00091631 [Helianthus anomalus]